MTSNIPDHELERDITRCGQRMRAAMAQGNQQEAMDWMQAQTLAIGRRSPAQAARIATQCGNTN